MNVQLGSEKSVTYFVLNGKDINLLLSDLFKLLISNPYLPYASVCGWGGSAAQPITMEDMQRV